MILPQNCEGLSDAQEYKKLQSLQSQFLVEELCSNMLYSAMSRVCVDTYTHRYTYIYKMHVEEGFVLAGTTL